MNRDEYERMFRAEESHWWFLARRDLLEIALDRFRPPPAPPDVSRPARLLDVGCGTGGTLRRLTGFGTVCGIDIEPLALAACRTRGARRIALGIAEALPFGDETFEAVTAMDVLEHVAEDSRAVREMARILAPDGVLLISVPAYPALWSPHDDALMHRRRYVARSLRSLVSGAPELDLVYLTYVVTALLPVAFVVRRVQQARRRTDEAPRADIAQPRAALNRLLRRWHRAEARMAIRHPLPFGLSLFAVARKRTGSMAGHPAVPAESEPGRQ